MVLALIFKGISMKYIIKKECIGVDWQAVSDLLKNAGMAFYEPDVQKKAFEASYIAIFIYHDLKLIGSGRALSDGAYQAAVYDCAVSPAYQGKGIGKLIVTNILSALQNYNIILYATPGKEGFYQKYGFKKMKTGMAKFIKSDVMSERGFTE